MESVIKKYANKHQQRWMVPSVVGDMSLLACTCMYISNNTHLWWCLVESVIIKYANAPTEMDGAFCSG